jgi:glycosyltransferase involved in cell wall biosynthesis
MGRHIGRVGILTNIYTPYKQALLRSLSSKVDLTVYYCAEREPGRDWKVDFGSAYSFKMLPGIHPHLSGSTLHFNWGLSRELRADNISVLIIGGYSFPTVVLAPFVARCLGIDRILWSGSTLLEQRAPSAIKSGLKRLLVRQYDSFIAYTERAAEYLRDLGARPESVYVAPVTVDVSHFSEVKRQVNTPQSIAQVRVRHGIPVDSFLWIFVGQLIPRKGADFLLRVFQNLRHSHASLVLVGSGPERANLEALTTAYGIADRVRFVGFLDQHALAELYSAADAFVLPSRLDPSANVINEAMATGLPTLISDKIGTDIVRPDQEGYVLPSEDVGAWANCMLRLQDDAPLRTRLGAQARTRALNDYSIERQVQGFMRALHHLRPNPDACYSPRDPEQSTWCS